MPRDPEEMLADWEHRIQQQTTLTSELSEQLERTSASVEAADGVATVTVDSSGALTELRISDDAMRLPAGELASIILETNRLAQAKMAQQMVEVVSGLYGAGSETASFIGGVYTERFPQPPEDEERDGR